VDCEGASPGFFLSLAVLALEAAAGFAFGAVTGFLFGIPRNLQGQGSQNPQPASQPNASSLPLANPSALADSRTSSQTSTIVYQPRPEATYASNTNLEQISDWLTKIIVGVGLINLKNFPSYLKATATYFGSLSSCGQGYVAIPESVSLATLLYFFVCGFFFAYLLTRLALPAAFSRADRAALSSVWEKLETTGGKLETTQAEQQKVLAIVLTGEARELISQSQDSEDMLNNARQRLELAIKYDPSYFVAYTEKGRALKRLAQLKNDPKLLEQALEAVTQARKLNPTNFPAVYNSACYKALLKRPAAEVLEDLRAAIALNPSLKKVAQGDSDLAGIRSSNPQEIQALLSTVFSNRRMSLKKA
jgi:tetratricopeptide (TPR) repeat protein